MQVNVLLMSKSKRRNNVTNKGSKTTFLRTFQPYLNMFTFNTAMFTNSFENERQLKNNECSLSDNSLDLDALQSTGRTSKKRWTK